MNKFIQVEGNPLDGFKYNGPFDTFDAALADGEENIGGGADWWIIELIGANSTVATNTIVTIHPND